jgi:hypothetical protein
LDYESKNEVNIKPSSIVIAKNSHGDDGQAYQSLGGKVVRVGGKGVFARVDGVFMASSLHQYTFRSHSRALK